MKTIIGAGIISLPFAFSKLGYILGLILFFIMIIISQFNCIMILKAKNLTKQSNYSSIAYYIF
jgi:amino acid permease